MLLAHPLKRRKGGRGNSDHYIEWASSSSLISASYFSIWLANAIQLVAMAIKTVVRRSDILPVFLRRSHLDRLALQPSTVSPKGPLDRGTLGSVDAVIDTVLHFDDARLLAA
jgi:hypothetical protein